MSLLLFLSSRSAFHTVKWLHWNAKNGGGVTYSLNLPTREMTVESFRVPEDYRFAYPGSGPFRARTLVAAPHVIPDIRGPYTPGVDGRLDIGATIRFRRYLWDLGFGIADAMSTAERGPGGITWSQVKDLLQAARAEARPGEILMGGVGTDQHDPGTLTSLTAVTDAFLEQLAFVEGCGITPILRGSHHLAGLATGPADYAAVYDRVLDAAAGPVVIHWSGAIFGVIFIAVFLVVGLPWMAMIN